MTTMPVLLPKYSWDRQELSPYTMILKVGGVIDDHNASMTPQVQFFPAWTPILLSTSPIT